MTSTIIRKRSSIALVSIVALVALAIVVLPGAAGAAAGDLDPSFGVGGKVVTDFSGSNAAQTLILQPNGKLVAGGDATGAGGDFALARYLPNGSLDPVFDGDGKVTTDFGRSESLWGLAFRPGQIVAAGTTSECCPLSAIALARYRLDGSLDPTFGGDGKVTTDFGGLYATGNDVAIQPDGRIVVAGDIYLPGPPVDRDFGLSRFNVDGSLDASFGTAGLAVTDFGTSEDQPWAIALQADGRIIVAGLTRSTDNESDLAVARYDPSGTLDQSFGGDGKVTIDFGGLDFAFDVAVQSDGKLVVVGATTASGSHDFAIARLNADGRLDTQGLDPYLDAPFGTDGKVTTDFGAADDDQATSVAIEPSGKILVAGLATPAGTIELADFGLARYNVDGSLDSTFGSGGTLTTRFSAAEDVPWEVVVQRDGRIVLAGSAGEGSSYDFALARYLVRPCCTAEGSPPGGPPPPGPLP